RLGAQGVTVLDAVWLIPAFPLAGFVLLVLFGRVLGEPRAGWLATVAMLGSFVSSIVVFAGLLDREAEERHFTQTLFEWVPAGNFSVDVGFLVDPLSIAMCLFITGVGMLIHLYSIGYMHGDPKFSKFFVYLNLFAFSMLMLVLGDNLLLTFLGWEGVGACSYFLIAFWHTSEANASAGKKAFVTNRVGDWGFMVAMFFAFGAVGTIQYSGLLGEAETLSETTATAIAVLLFVGACGKSAQFPLYLWLPDAMAGPTPVSALIHAATMVTSGVYLMTRINPILAASADWVPTLIAAVGAATAIFAATIAVAQNDIKKVLAYSTVSQLGFMFLAVGSGVYVAAIFHMITHAFFKALLFLGSGAVIHGMHDDQDMRHYGNLRAWMPITATTFIVGWLAIAGIPPFAGFWSKDEILAAAYDKNGVLYAIGLVAALLTAFYMSRLVFLTFFGRYRYADPRPAEIDQAWDARLAAAKAQSDAAAAEAAAAQQAVEVARTKLAEAEGDARPAAAEAVAEAERAAAAKAVVAADAQKAVAAVAAQAAARPRQAVALFDEPDVSGVEEYLPDDVAHRRELHPHEAGPLMWVPLVVLAIASIAGGVLNLPFTDDTKFLEHWLEPVLGENEHHLSFGGGTLFVLAVVATVLSIVGILVAAAVYLRGRVSPRVVEQPVLAHGWYYDETVTAVAGGPGRKLFDLLALFDRAVIDGAVNGVARFVLGSAWVLRRVQSGFVRSYALGVAIGAFVLMGYFFLTRAS
ncbi:MAG TPA: NADH-quinone oxidoreductase subunit L, partial [Acidimicrobiales bacterium]